MDTAQLERTPPPESVTEDPQVARERLELKLMREFYGQNLKHTVGYDNEEGIADPVRRIITTGSVERDCLADVRYLLALIAREGITP